MARSPSAFRQTDITKALKAVRVAGYSAARVLVGKDGRIEIITNPAPARGEPDTTKPDDDDDRNEWDAVR